MRPLQCSLENGPLPRLGNVKLLVPVGAFHFGMSRRTAQRGPNGGQQFWSRLGVVTGGEGPPKERGKSIGRGRRVEDSKTRGPPILASVVDPEPRREVSACFHCQLRPNNYPTDRQRTTDCWKCCTTPTGANLSRSPVTLQPKRDPLMCNGLPTRNTIKATRATGVSRR